MLYVYLTLCQQESKKMTKKIQPQDKAMFKEICELIDSYGSIRSAAKVLNFSPTFLSNIKRGITSITPDLAKHAGWVKKTVWVKYD